MSDLNVGTISDLAGTGPVTLTKQSASKVWVKYTTVSSTAADNSFNVSSLTDQGTGQTDINFTNNMDSADYAIAHSAPISSGNLAHTNFAAGSIRATAYNNTPSAADQDDQCHMIAGDLA